MKEIQIKELKQIQLEMLSDIHNFCVNNNIMYSLAYGTLLGAVRHKGYIPWDDDIDILMRRDDYERFIKTYTHHFFKVADTSTLKGYYLPFAKVCDSRTIMKEATTQKIEIGVYIDVFPVDNMPDDERCLNKMFRTKSFWNFIHNIKIDVVNNRRLWFKNLILSFGHALFSVIPISLVVERMKKLAITGNNFRTSRRAVFVTADNKRHWMLPSKMFDEYVEIEFEGRTFLSLKEFNKYLTAMYGDYMKLPPIEKRVTHHDFKAWWR